MKKKTKKQIQRKNHNHQVAHTSTLTFIDHVRELQGRLFWVVLAFIITAVAAYPFFNDIVRVLVQPLGPDHQLVYLTPGGGFGFILQVCIYVGIIGSLPIVVYQLYKFVAPSMKFVHSGRVLGYAVASFLLAAVGIAFAYAVSLPAALYFLTNFDLQQVTPMLTIDSYFSFIMAYLLAGALLFQLPLIMLIVNAVKPQGPRQFMKYQRHILLGAFIFAAVVSPTPDALNQTILALPVVIVYQFGGALVWMRNRQYRRDQRARKTEFADSELKPIVPVRPFVANTVQNVYPPVQQQTMRPTMSGDILHGKSRVIATTSPTVQTQQPFVKVAIPAKTTSLVREHQSSLLVRRPIYERKVQVLQRSNSRARSIDGFGFAPTTPLSA